MSVCVFELGKENRKKKRFTQYPFGIELGFLFEPFIETKFFAIGNQSTTLG